MVEYIQIYIYIYICNTLIYLNMFKYKYLKIFRYIQIYLDMLEDISTYLTTLIIDMFKYNFRYRINLIMT